MLCHMQYLFLLYPSQYHMIGGFQMIPSQSFVQSIWERCQVKISEVKISQVKTFVAKMSEVNKSGLYVRGKISKLEMPQVEMSEVL